MIDRSRHMMAIGAGAAKEGAAARRNVLRRQPRQHALDLHLACMVGKREMRRARGCGHVAEQFIDRRDADLGQHGAPVFGG